METTRILFLCLGNICRSPMAEAVFRDLLVREGLKQSVEVDSAGLGDWHEGEAPHRGTQRILRQYGIAFDDIRSRPITKQDLENSDYIVAMDKSNVEGLRSLGKAKGTVLRLMELVDASAARDVPDPYYTGNFEEVYDMVREGCEALLARVKAELPTS